MTEEVKKGLSPAQRVARGQRAAGIRAPIPPIEFGGRIQKLEDQVKDLQTGEGVTVLPASGGASDASKDEKIAELERQVAEATEQVAAVTQVCEAMEQRLIALEEARETQAPTEDGAEQESAKAGDDDTVVDLIDAVEKRVDEVSAQVKAVEGRVEDIEKRNAKPATNRSRANSNRGGKQTSKPAQNKSGS